MYITCYFFLFVIYCNFINSYKIVKKLQYNNPSSKKSEIIKKYYFDKTNIFIKNEKLISISPGGLKGFYLLGILTFIKENYNINNFIFSGASAGAWNSLFMCYKGNTIEFINNLMNDKNIINVKSIYELELKLKKSILEKYNNNFELTKLFISVTVLNNLTPEINIYSNFENLEDAIDCCIASSHIPLVTGGLMNTYKNKYTFDGGYSNDPYLDIIKPIIHITPNIIDNISNKNNNKFNKILNFNDIFSLKNNNFLELFNNGYNDANKYKYYFDNIFSIEAL
jgi:predicted patatin/cPLA2 family phospholipase